MNKRHFLFSAALLLAASSAFAQGNGLSGINEATSMVTVYGKFSSGDPDTSKTAASWFGACIFLIVAATILRSFFL